MRTARRINLIITLTGTIVFAAMLIWLQTMPLDVANRAGDFVTTQVADSTRDRLFEAASTRGDGITDGLMRRAASTLLNNTDEGETLMRERLVPWVATVVATNCSGCGTPEGVPDILAPVLEKTEPWVREQFRERLDGLIASLSIFAATNLALFAAALGLGAFKGRASIHLLTVSAMMVGTILLASWWYVAGQDWFLVLVSGDFVGVGYAMFTGIVLLFLMDIAFLKGAIIGTILDGFFHFIGSAISVGPCG